MSPASLTTALLTFVAWAVLALLSDLLGDHATQTASVLLTSGLIFGLLVAVRPVKRTVVLVTGALAAITFSLLDGQAVLPALGFGISEVLAAGMGALVANSMRKNSPPDTGSGPPGVAALLELAEPGKAYAGLVLGALVAATVGASMSLALWSWTLPEPGGLAREWRSWVSSSFVSILLVAPVVISFAGFRVKRSGGMGKAQFTAGLISLLLFFLVAALVFSQGVSERFGESLGPTLTYLPLPFIVITAILWKERGATLATLFGGLAVIAWTNAGGGPFPELEAFPGESVIEVQVYVAVMAVLVGVVNALGAAGDHALLQAQEWRTRYRQVLDSSRIAVASFDAATGAAQWGDGAAELLHANTARLQNVRDLIACAPANEQAGLLADWDALVRGESRSVHWNTRLRWRDGTGSQMSGRLSGISGIDGQLEEVAALLRLEDVDAA